MKNRIIKSLFYNKNDQLNGAFKYISRITKHEDIHSSNDIIISVSSNDSTSNLITKPLGLPGQTSGNLYWLSQNIDNSWYQVDLRSYKIKVKGYEYYAFSFDYFPNWRLLGSRNGNEWVTLDNNGRTSYPSSTEYEKNYYECSENVHEAFSFIRLQVSGKRKLDDKHYFDIYRFELYGLIYTSVYCTCSNTRRSLSMILLINIFVAS